MGQALFLEFVIFYKGFLNVVYYLIELYSMFTKLYLKTTDPRICMYKTLRENISMILISVIFHTLVYSSILNLASFIFLGKLLSTEINFRLITILFMIMLIGYIARIRHVKDIYHAYGENIDKARNHIDRFFISWVFIG